MSDSNIQSIFEFLVKEQSEKLNSIEFCFNNIKAGNLTMLDSHIQRLETAKVEQLVVTEILELFERNENITKPELLKILHEMLVTSTAFVDLTKTHLAKRAAYLGKMITTFSSMRY